MTTDNAATALSRLFDLIAEKHPEVRGLYDTPEFGALARTVYAALAAAVPAGPEEPTPAMISAALFALWGAPIPSRKGMEVQDALTDTGRIVISREEWWDIAATVLRAGLNPEWTPDASSAKEEG